MPDPATNPATTGRGIQPGKIAASPQSVALHRSTETIAKCIHAEYSRTFRRLVWRPKLSSRELIDLGHLRIDPKVFPIAGVAPDGGIFLYEHPRRGMLPLFSIESKNQQNAGNAIERWFKNYTALKHLGPSIAYLTFCTGTGAQASGVMVKALNHALLEFANAQREQMPRNWNRIYTRGPSMFRRVSGFSEIRMAAILRGMLDLKLASIERE